VHGQTSDPMPWSVTAQWKTLAKVMTFERHLVAAGDTVMVGIIYQGKVRESDLVRQQLTQAIDALPNVGGLAYDHVTIDIEDVGTLATQLRQSRVDVLYIAPVRALDVADIAAICHNMGHITLTGVPRYVAKGVAIGMDMKGDSLELLVNRRAIRQASADLSSRVLALARIVD